MGYSGVGHSVFLFYKPKSYVTYLSQLYDYGLGNFVSICQYVSQF